VNIASMKSLAHGDNSASVFLTVETKGVAQLSRLLSKIERIGGVTNVARGSE
jgi:(p)ppGpp synthase/HD superfamily hydrolase